MSKKDGKITKFYNYDKTSGRINIPDAIADLLNWVKNDVMTIEIINGRKGLFLFKKED